MAKVTILVPMYNVEKYVSKCLKSLISQTYKDIEIWAVNDGSPDNSREVVLRYAKKDSRIKLIDKSNGGYGSVLQFGVDNITSPYFLVCDPDDWLEETAIEELYNFANLKDLDMVVGDYYNVYVGEKNKILEHSLDSSKIRPKKVYTSNDMIQSFSFGSVSPHSKLFRTNMLRNALFPNKVNYTDFILFIYALSCSKRIAYYNVPLSNYLKDRPNNSTTMVSPTRLKDHAVAWLSAFNQLDITNKNKILFRRMYEAVLGNLIMYSMYSKEYFKDEYWQDILKTVIKIRKVKPILEEDLSSENWMQKKLKIKLLDEGSYETTAKFYVRYINMHNSVRNVIKKLCLNLNNENE